jgi:hypothetical protein
VQALTQNQLFQTKPTAVEMKAYAMAGLKRLFDQGKCILVAKDGQGTLTRSHSHYQQARSLSPARHPISSDTVHVLRDPAVAHAHRGPHQVMICRHFDGAGAV